MGWDATLGTLAVLVFITVLWGWAAWRDNRRARRGRRRGR